MRNKLKYQVRDPCKESCRRKCTTHFTEDDRKSIDDAFWELDFADRRLWLDAHIKLTSIKRRASQGDTLHIRNTSHFYQLPHGLIKVFVCKTFFLHTLGLKCDSMITQFVNAKRDGSDKFIHDSRGRAEPKTKKDHQSSENISCITRKSAIITSLMLHTDVIWNLI